MACKIKLERPLLRQTPKEKTLKTLPRKKKKEFLIAENISKKKCH
jgi:hypothetical protein